VCSKWRVYLQNRRGNKEGKKKSAKRDVYHLRRKGRERIDLLQENVKKRKTWEERARLTNKEKERSKHHETQPSSKREGAILSKIASKSRGKSGHIRAGLL